MLLLHTRLSVWAFERAPPSPLPLPSFLCSARSIAPGQAGRWKGGRWEGRREGGRRTKEKEERNHTRAYLHSDRSSLSSPQIK